jgi:hypothetical protein
VKIKLPLSLYAQVTMSQACRAISKPAIHGFFASRLPTDTPVAVAPHLASVLLASGISGRKSLAVMALIHLPKTRFPGSLTTLRPEGTRNRVTAHRGGHLSRRQPEVRRGGCRLIRQLVTPSRREHRPCEGRPASSRGPRERARDTVSKSIRVRARCSLSSACGLDVRPTTVAPRTMQSDRDCRTTRARKDRRLRRAALRL